MKKAILSVLLAACTFTVQNKALAQDGKPSKGEKLAIALGKHQFLFDATTATPQRGISRTLTPGNFFLQIKDDSLICELPFFGRRYSEPTNEELIYGGYQFSTRRFSITASPEKHGRADIQIATRPFSDELKIGLSISKNGWADVLIQSSGREPISYYGSIKPLPEVNKP